MADAAVATATATTGSSTPAHQNGGPRSSSVQPTKPTYKSWRKKYYKMRHRFQSLMIQNHKRFDEEQNTIRLARRLQEQNDQLLQLLYDSNESERLPSKFRYDIHPKAALPALPDPQTLANDQEGGESKPKLISNPAKALALLENVPHSSLGDLPADLKSVEEADQSVFDEYIGYLSPPHEAEYLSALDAFETRSRASNADTSMPHGPWSNHDSAGAALKNPVSVYNWLKKNQPSVFLNDNEEKEKERERDKPPVGTFAAKEDRSSARAVPTKVQPKRASVGARHHADDALDEDSYPSGGGGGGGGGGSNSYENTGSMRGKRKQPEDEAAYRPKGGNSRKKKKLSGPSGLPMNDPEAPS